MNDRQNQTTDTMPDIKPSQKVIVRDVPAALLVGLPEEDQLAIQAILGHQVDLVGYDYGKVEIEFFDADGDCHTIWVDVSSIEQGDAINAR